MADRNLHDRRQEGHAQDRKADRNLRRLRRQDLLRMLLELERENEQLAAENAELKEQLASRRFELAEAGSLADVAARVSGILLAAQETADLYLSNIRDTKGSTPFVSPAQAPESKGTKGVAPSVTSAPDVAPTQPPETKGTKGVAPFATQDVAPAQAPEGKGTKGVAPFVMQDVTAASESEQQRVTKGTTPLCARPTPDTPAPPRQGGEA